VLEVLGGPRGEVIRIVGGLPPEPKPDEPSEAPSPEGSNGPVNSP
jgi:hypothetical protein